MSRDRRTVYAVIACTFFVGVGGGLGPLVEQIGFAPIYAACAMIPLAAGLLLLFGIRAETGSLNPSLDVRPSD